jgi:phage portal protein BeeE
MMPKATAHNLRRFAETPVARKAINVVKDRVSGMRWRIQPKNGRTMGEIPAGAERVRLLTDNFDAPNPDDTFRSFSEQVLEDVIVGGFGAIEVCATGDPARPLVLWPVDGASIQIKSDWDGQPGSPRYVQKLGLFGTGGSVVLNDDELIYVRLNARTHTPFGLGRLEVAFETINSFLCAHRYASKLASNSVAQYALWLQGLSAPQHERLIRWWQDEIEGTGKVPLMTTEAKPEVLRFGGGTDQDLRLAWQEFLMRIIADAFDLPPFLLGVEHDVNRSTAGELSDQAFRSAIVPTARLFAESLSRGAIEKKLGWHDLEFVFTDVDSRNELEEVQIQERLIRCGVLTVDEVREMRGLGRKPASE